MEMVQKYTDTIHNGALQSESPDMCRLVVRVLFSGFDTTAKCVRLYQTRRRDTVRAGGL